MREHTKRSRGLEQLRHPRTMEIVNGYQQLSPPPQVEVTSEQLFTETSNRFLLELIPRLYNIFLIQLLPLQFVSICFLSLSFACLFFVLSVICLTAVFCFCLERELHCNHNVITFFFFCFFFWGGGVFCFEPDISNTFKLGLAIQLPSCSKMLGRLPSPTTMLSKHYLNRQEKGLLCAVRVSNIKQGARENQSNVFITF